ncbi:MAG: hypothetical protein ACI3W8_04905 [Oscillospiraceae bacterium]
MPVILLCIPVSGKLRFAGCKQQNFAVPADFDFSRAFDAFNIPETCGKFHRLHKETPKRALKIFRGLPPAAFPALGVMAVSCHPARELILFQGVV